MVEDPATDRVVKAAIVGAAGLRGTWAALEAEQDRCPGEQGDPGPGGTASSSSWARRADGGTILPVDSEHSSDLPGPPRPASPSEVRRVILTSSASGSVPRPLVPSAGRRHARGERCGPPDLCGWGQQDLRIDSATGLPMNKPRSRSSEATLGSFGLRARPDRGRRPSRRAWSTSDGRICRRQRAGRSSRLPDTCGCQSSSRSPIPTASPALAHYSTSRRQ